MGRLKEIFLGTPPESEQENNSETESRSLPFTTDLDSVIPYTLPDEYSTNTASGASVTEQSSLASGVVYAAVSLIADGVSSLRLRAFELDAMGRRVYAPVPRWIDSPSPEKGMGRSQVFNQLLVSALLWGNAYAFLDRRPSDGVIIGMRPIDPNRVTVEWDKDRKGYRRYRIDGTGKWLTTYDIFHLQGPTLPGASMGMSVISLARESIGLGLTLEDFGARYFGQGSQAKIVLELPNNVDEPKAREIVRTFERFHRGKRNWHRPAIMSGGAKLHNITIPPNDAQFLESREFQAVEIARWFRVPPHRIGVISKQSSWGSGLQEENLAMLQNTFRPWIQRIEELLTSYTKGGAENGLQIEFQVDELLKGTFAQMATVVNELVTSGVLTRQEGRDMLGYPDDGKGDVILTPEEPPTIL